MSNFNFELPETTNDTPRVSSILPAFSTSRVVIDPTSIKVEKGTKSPFIVYRLVSEEENEEINQPDFIGTFAKHRSRVSECAPLWISDTYNNWDTVKTFLQKLTVTIFGDDTKVVAFLNDLATKALSDPLEIAEEVAEYMIHVLADAPFIAVLGGILTTGKDEKDYLGSMFSPIRGYNIFCMPIDTSEAEQAVSLQARINGEISFNTNPNKSDELGFMTRMFKDDRTDRSTPLNERITNQGFTLAYNRTVFGDIPGEVLPTEATENAPVENSNNNTKENDTSSSETDDDLPF